MAVTPAPGDGLRRPYPPGVPPVQRRELVAWAFYDFANSGYTTVVITAVFNAYFVAVVAGGAPWATLAWTSALSAAYLLVMAVSPVLGVWTDLHQRRKSALAATTAVCVAGTAGLAWCGPGDVALAVALLIASNLAWSLGESLIAAFLPELARDEAIGRLSGYGWALGYVGGLAVLGLCLAWIESAPARGANVADAVPQTMLITAVAFAITALPTLLVLRERRADDPATGGTAGTSGRASAPTPPRIALVPAAIARLRQALAGSEGLVDLRRLLVCIACYQSGVATVITVAAIFTTQALGFTQQESIVLILVVNVSAAVGAFAFGWLQDRIGHRSTLALTLVGWLAGIGVFALSSDRTMVWIAANIAGLCLGSSMSAGRALVAYLCPPDREGEIFGLWNLAVRVAMIAGPLCYGLISWLSDGNHVAALLSTAVFFVGGLILLARVDVARGHRLARGAQPVVATGHAS
jgi:UMF1 family MFS transporter